MPMQPARLGELQPPQNGFFPLNSHVGGFKGLEGLEVERIERKEGEREKEEETKLRHYRITTVITPYIVLLFHVPHATVN